MDAGHAIPTSSPCGSERARKSSKGDQKGRGPTVLGAGIATRANARWKGRGPNLATRRAARHPVKPTRDRLERPAGWRLVAQACHQRFGRAHQVVPTLDPCAVRVLRKAPRMNWLGYPRPSRRVDRLSTRLATSRRSLCPCPSAPTSTSAFAPRRSPLLHLDSTTILMSTRDNRLTK